MFVDARFQTELSRYNRDDMRLNDPPENECPACEQHPSLVYESSVGPGRVGRPGEDVAVHFYLCAMCGRRFRVDGSGNPAAYPSNQELKPFEKKCFACGDSMRVQKIAKSPKLRGPYHRVESTLGWRCGKCGTTQEFHHADVLGFE
jgi:uncharacterized protein with PIN domain